MTVEQTLARFALSDLKVPPRDLARLCLFDWAVCGIAGIPEPVSSKLRDKAISEAGRPDATLIGGGNASAPQAALLNGATSHALDYDDTHFAHIGHTSVVVISSALAVAETTGASFDELLDAIAVGSEAAIRVGQWLGRRHYQIGFHQTATSGAFGATLAACRLLKLSEEETVIALGLCASRASGLKAQFGTMAKPLNAGIAAEAGVQAALWVHAGITASLDALSAYAATHHGEKNDDALKGLGENWQFCGISHKFHACCHGLHAMLEALLSVECNTDAIRKVEVCTNPRWMSVCNIAQPETGLEAKFSYRFTAAMALSGVDTASIESYTCETVKNQELQRLSECVSVLEDAGISETASRITVHLAGGEMIEANHDLLSPLTMEMRADKLHRKASSILGVRHTQRLWGLAQGDDLIDFVSSLSDHGVE